MRMKVNSDSKQEFFYSALKVTGLFSPKEKSISDAEADLLSRFMALPSTHRFYPFSYKARKLVSESYSPTISKQNLSQKVTALLEKGYLYRDEDNFIDYNPVLKKMLELKEFNVTIVNRSTDKEDVTAS